MLLRPQQTSGQANQHRRMKNKQTNKTLQNQNSKKH